jgi:hypothetical protein
MTEPNQANPLLKYFRQPQLHLKLPSGGKWWKPGSLELPVTGELPVYAMTARDELASKTPDALLNGQSTVDVIQSCCPSIKDAWQIPSVDLDSILIAIRLATYGNHMEFVSVCPHCNNKNEHAADLQFLLNAINCPDFETPVNIADLEIYLKPLTFSDFNKASIKSYEEQRLLSVVQNESISESEKLVKFNQLFRSVLDMTVKQLSNNVGGVRMPDGTLVSDTTMLAEFFANCDRPIWNSVRDRINNIGDKSELKNIPVKCDNEECQKEYTAPLQFELSSFFA